MPSNREIVDGLDLGNLLHEYYRSRGRRFVALGGEDKEEGFSSYLLIDRKHVIEYFVATDQRNFFSCVLLGIGPKYVPLNWIVGEESDAKFRMGNTVDALEENLRLLDEYLDGHLC